MTHQQPAAAYIRSGQTPFFRLPFANLTADGVAHYEGVDAVLLGVPWDGGTTYRPGARLAPWEVRRASAHVQSLHGEMPLDVFATINAVDGGNTALTPFSAPFMRDVVEVCPDLDVGDATSTLAAHLLYEGLAVLASRTRL